MYDVTLNTEARVSKTLYPMCADYTLSEARELIHRVIPVSNAVIHVEDTLVVMYSTATLADAMQLAMRISNTLLQDCVAVRIRDAEDNVVLETLCGLNTAPYGEFNSEFFKE